MKKKALRLAVILLVLTLLSGCEDARGLNPDKPVTLTLWHNYGGQMKETMDNLIDEFNETVGAEKGIMLNVTSISSSAALHEKLMMIVNDDPGAPEMPDITTANPKTAMVLAEKGLLANLEDQFTDKELASYIPRFIEEGRLDTDQLYIFPTAKSTEVIFLNKTIFDRLTEATNVTYDDLKTFEGIAKAAERYYEWTDSLTPDTPDDGKAFFHSDSIFNLTQAGCKQLGVDFIKNGRPDYLSDAFRRVWDFYFKSAAKGNFAIFDGYASDLAKTGDIVCSVGSTAGVIFFDPVVTYPDNSTESAELLVLPYPVFEGGEKIAVQRGSGMIVSKTNETKNYAAGIFLKWFTSPENNMKFVAATGYQPVTKEAFGEVMAKESERVENRNIRTLLKTAMEMQKSYDYYIPPLFDGIDTLQDSFNSQMRYLATEARKEYRNQSSSENADTEIEALSDKFYKDLTTK